MELRPRQLKRESSIPDAARGLPRLLCKLQKTCTLYSAAAVGRQNLSWDAEGTGSPKEPDGKNHMGLSSSSFGRDHAASCQRLHMSNKD